MAQPDLLMVHGTQYRLHHIHAASMAQTGQDTEVWYLTTPDPNLSCLYHGVQDGQWGPDLNLGYGTPEEALHAWLAYHLERVLGHLGFLEDDWTKSLVKIMQVRSRAHRVRLALGRIDESSRG